MKRTKIVCTIGPTSEKEEVLEEIVKAGMNVMRLNFSHGSHEEHLAKVNTLRRINKKLNTNTAFLLDTKGPEIRTGKFEDGGTHTLTKGETVIVTTRKVPCTDEVLSVNYKDLHKDVKVGTHILVDDASLDLVITEINGQDMKCDILNSASIKSTRGVNVPNTNLNLPALTDKDVEDVKFACKEKLDYIAASFVRKREDVLNIRKICKENNHEAIKIISKIENQEGLDNFENILEVSDGIMVARGDLGTEVPFERVPQLQKMMIKKCADANKVVITATHMLESMIENPRPTRAEVSDVANAVYDGTSATMLSGETAYGEYPVESVKTMAKVAVESEENILFWKRFKKKNIEKLTNFQDIVIKDANDLKKQSNFAVCLSAMYSNAKAIIAITESGNTASILSSYKPACPILAITANETTYKQLALENNVSTVLIANEYDFNAILKKGINEFIKKGIIAKGDTVVLSGGDKQNKTPGCRISEATGNILTL